MPFRENNQVTSAILPFRETLTPDVDDSMVYEDFVKVHTSYGGCIVIWDQTGVSKSCAKWVDYNHMYQI
jgi:hypothetical protein